MDEGTKDKLVQKMLLCYIQNGEKNYKEAHKSRKCGLVKTILTEVLALVGYFAFVCWYIMPYGFAFATLFCL